MPLHAPPDQDIVIVGATGDLAQRKLIPALYNLHRQKLLPAKGEIIGAAPFDWDDQRFRDLAESAVKEFSRTPLQKTVFASFAQRLHFVPLPPDGDLCADPTGERRWIGASHISRFRHRRSRRSSKASRRPDSSRARRSSSRSRSVTT